MTLLFSRIVYRNAYTVCLYTNSGFTVGLHRLFLDGACTFDPDQFHRTPKPGLWFC